MNLASCCKLLKEILKIVCRQRIGAHLGSPHTFSFPVCLYCSMKFMGVIFFLQSIFNMIPVDDQKSLPEDENTPEKRAEKIWAFFGKKDNGKFIRLYFVRKRKNIFN